MLMYLIDPAVSWGLKINIIHSLSVEKGAEHFFFFLGGGEAIQHPSSITCIQHSSYSVNYCYCCCWVMDNFSLFYPCCLIYLNTVTDVH